MRKEILDIKRQSEEDMKTAQVLLRDERYYASVFFSQQASEKALKALCLHKLRKLPQSHNLVELSNALRAPKDIISAAMELNPEYLTTRYVDAANGVPADMYDEDSAKMHLDCAEKICKWAAKLIE